MQNKLFAFFISANCSATLTLEIVASAGAGSTLTVMSIAIASLGSASVLVTSGNTSADQFVC